MKTPQQIQAITPQTEEEHIIHAINIQGIFFERWCQKTIVVDDSNWHLKSTNYPIEYPAPNGPFRGKDSKLDIRAEFRTNDILLTLLLECKKNNPEFINWVFFPHYRYGLIDVSPTISQITNTPSDPSTNAPPMWTVLQQLIPFPSIFKVADEARETRGSYHDFKKQNKNLDQMTRTSNTAITDASLQIALATQAIFTEEVMYSNNLSNADPPTTMPYTRQLFIPAIVTTARLFMCNFDVGDISGISGEIPLSKTTIEEHPYLLYEYV